MERFIYEENDKASEFGKSVSGIGDIYDNNTTYMIMGVPNAKFDYVYEPHHGRTGVVVAYANPPQGSGTSIVIHPPSYEEWIGLRILRPRPQG